jgi:hypothetical protein
MHNAAVAGALPRLGGTLHGLVTAACGAPNTYGRAPIGEHDQWFKAVYGCCAGAIYVAISPPRCQSRQMLLA